MLVLNKKTSFSVLVLLQVILHEFTACASEPAGWQESVNNFITGINKHWGAIVFWSDHPLKLPFILVVMVFGGLFFFSCFENIRFLSRVLK